MATDAEIRAAARAFIAAAFTALHPEHFAEPLKRRHAEFASSYIFSFLETAIARCARQEWRGNFDPDSTAVDETIDELLAVLATTTNEIVCCRHVSHLTTTSDEEAQLNDVTVVAGDRDARAHRPHPA